MDNNEILASAIATNYAALYINRTTRLGPGHSHWIAQLARLTPDERQVLESKLQRWEDLKRRGQSRSNVVDIATLQRQLAARYGSNASSQSIQELAKEGSSNPDARQQSRPSGLVARLVDGQRVDNINPS